MEKLEKFKKTFTVFGFWVTLEWLVSTKPDGSFSVELQEVGADAKLFDPDYSPLDTKSATWLNGYLVTLATQATLEHRKMKTL